MPASRVLRITGRARRTCPEPSATPRRAPPAYSWCIVQHFKSSDPIHQNLHVHACTPTHPKLSTEGHFPSQRSRNVSLKAHTKLWRWGFSSSPSHLTRIRKQKRCKGSRSGLSSCFLIQHKQQESGMAAKAGLTGYQLFLRKGTLVITAFSFYALAQEYRPISTFPWRICFSFLRHAEVLLKIHGEKPCLNRSLVPSSPLSMLVD